MSPTSSPGQENQPPTPSHDPSSPTIAQFSPVTFSQPSIKQRSTIVVHQKSPLLVATPPQVTRVLAYSHPFILPLNKLAGLLSWTSGDPWESFLLVAGFWAVALYGNLVTRWAGPVVLVTVLIVCMYARRYSPLSSKNWNEDEKVKGHTRQSSHHKSLDEILETLKTFTARCNLLLLPALQLTEFLSTQQSATSATTRPALTNLFVRILLLTPIWILLGIARVITTRRVVLTVGTIVLTWHSRPARVSRAILWRSSLIRRLIASLTGLRLSLEAIPRPVKDKGASETSTLNVSAAHSGKRRPTSPGVRFTFVLYENQRRWLGLGWTNSLFAYERAAWTDEHLNAASPRSEFSLPDVEDGNAKWRWVDGSEWRVEGAAEGEEGGGSSQVGEHSKAGRGGGWIYYDNKWRDGRRGQDGWGRYTRRRRWYRDAELVEITPSTEATPSSTPAPEQNQGDGPDTLKAATSQDSDTEAPEKKRWFRKGKRTSRASSLTTSEKGSGSFKSASERAWEDDPGRASRDDERDWGGGVGDDARMGFG